MSEPTAPSGTPCGTYSAAKILRITEADVRRLVEAGVLLPAAKSGGTWKFRYEDILDYRRRMKEAT